MHRTGFGAGLLLRNADRTSNPLEAHSAMTSGVPAPSVIAKRTDGAVVSVAAALDSVRYSARSATMGLTRAARRAGA